MSNKLTKKVKPTKQKEPVYNFKMSDIERIKQDAMVQAIETAFIMMLAIPVSVMNDKYDWGKVRCERLVNQILERYDAYQKDYISLDDLKQTLYEQSNIQLVETVDDYKKNKAKKVTI